MWLFAVLFIYSFVTIIIEYHFVSGTVRKTEVPESSLWRAAQENRALAYREPVRKQAKV